jgi:hypothetical protein
MWFIAEDESRQWCLERGIKIDGNGFPTVAEEGWLADTFSLQDQWPRLTALSQIVASQLAPFDECLLWVTLWGVWSSSENFHLFYRLRSSYGEGRRLNDGPGHLFLKHEVADLATFIQVCLINGWDFHLLPVPAWKAAFVSHDEALDFYALGAGEDALETIRVWFANKAATAAAP